jgi:ubiquitin C-terminal hydrolase
MNINNPLGTNGKVAKCYAEFIKNMWCGTYDSYSPYQLKSAVGAKNQIFMGFAQHDSH